MIPSPVCSPPFGGEISLIQERVYLEYTLTMCALVKQVMG